MELPCVFQATWWLGCYSTLASHSLWEISQHSRKHEIIFHLFSENKFPLVLIGCLAKFCINCPTILCLTSHLELGTFLSSIMLPTGHPSSFVSIELRFLPMLAKNSWDSRSHSHPRGLQSRLSSSLKRKLFCPQVKEQLQFAIQRKRKAPDSLWLTRSSWSPSNNLFLRHQEGTKETKAGRCKWDWSKLPPGSW